MVCDIELTSEFSSFDNFYGVFDGDSHRIKNVFSVLANKYKCGIFRRNYGIIKNLKISTNNKSFYSDGGITYLNYGVITNCFFEGNINGYVGSNSYSLDGGKTLLKDEKYTQGNVDYYGIGGMVGHNYGIINNSCYSGDVRAKQGNTVGGFVGVNAGVIENCKYSGNVRVDVVFFGSSYQYSNIAAGFAGLNATNGSINYATADTNSIFLSTDNAYTGAEIDSFCKNTGSLTNCSNSNTGMTLDRGYIEWGATAVYPQTFDGSGYAEPEHLHHYQRNMINPTCTETGSAQFLCEACDNTFEYDNIPALGHDYQRTVVPPTYEAQGYTLRTCRRCDLNEQIDFVESLKVVTASCGDNVNYTLDTGTGLLTISGTGAMNAYPSAANVPWYADSALIKKVVIEEGVTAISGYAFKECANLAEVDIATTVQSFGNDCFYNCTGLTKTVYRGTVDTWAGISFGTLYANPIARSRNLLIDGEDFTEIVLSDGVTAVQPYAFVFLNKVERVVIPDSVETIGTYAFNWCSGVTEITMPCSAASADNYTFYGWQKLQAVTLTKGTGTMSSTLASYGPWCYLKTGIRTLILGDGIESICPNAFYNCTNLENITFPDNDYTIGGNAFSGTKWMQNRADENGLYILGTTLVDASLATGVVTIPDTVTAIGDYAFAGNANVSEVIIPDSVTSVGDFAFRNCRISKLTIPCSFDNYTQDAFAGWTSLKTLEMTAGTGVMPAMTTDACHYTHTPWYYSASVFNTICLDEGVSTIGDSAFKGLTALRTVTIPDSVTTIDNSAFSGDTAITKITLPNSVEAIHKAAFYSCSGLKELTMPCSAVIAEYTSTFSGCTNIETITLTKGTGTMPSFYKNYNCTPWYVSRTKLQQLTIEEGITNIGAHMFNGNTVIASLTMPVSVTKIGACAFYGCTNLSSISLSDSVTEIGAHAFYNCSKLRSVAFPSRLQTIGSYAFANSGLADATFYSTVSSIGTYAFSGCNALTALYLLNKNCTIGKSTSTFPTKTVLYGYSGSTLETYAITYSRTFVALDGSCIRCGAVDIYDSVVDPTCTEQGYCLHTCAQCGFSYKDNYTEATGHTVVSDAAVVPTCAAAGLTAGEHCSICQAVLVAQEVVPALEHTDTVDEAVAATCTATGLTEGSHCAVCGAVLTAQETIPMVAHQYQEIHNSATCTNEGYVIYQCTQCGNQLLEESPQQPHNYVKDEQLSRLSTCTRAGVDCYRCAVCGDLQITSLPVLAHQFEYTETQPSTPNERGCEVYTCCLCGATQQTPLPFDTDKSVLTELLQRVSSLAKDDYSVASYAALEAVCANTEELVDGDCPQAEIDAAITDIITAVNSLKPYVLISVTGVNGSVTVAYEGNTYMDSQCEVLYGTPVTLTAAPEEGYEFTGWYETTSKRYFSYDAEYTFFAASNMQFKATFRKAASATLSFTNDSGWVAKAINKTAEEWGKLNTIAGLLPAVPYKLGYENGRWEYADDEVLAQLRAGEDVTLTAVYDKCEDIPAMPDNPEVSDIPTLNINYRYDEASDIGSFVMKANIPADCTVNSIGIAFRYDKPEAFNPCDMYLTLNNKTTVSQFTESDAENTYIVNAKKLSRYSWAAVGYVTYFDSDNTLKTVYSNQINVINCVQQ